MLQKLAVLRMSRTGVASLHWKTTFELEFGETPDASCLKFKFYQLERAHDQFMNFPNNRRKNGQHLGVAQ